MNPDSIYDLGPNGRMSRVVRCGTLRRGIGSAVEPAGQRLALPDLRSEEPFALAFSKLRFDPRNGY